MKRCTRTMSGKHIFTMGNKVFIKFIQVKGMATREIYANECIACGLIDDLPKRKGKATL